jgi:hypothetical protein
MFDRLYRPRATLRALTGLDFGLRVRADVQSSQRSLFCGPENLAGQRLISELAEDITGLRVYSYALRGQLEDATAALRLNAEWADRGATLGVPRWISPACSRWRRSGGKRMRRPAWTWRR